MQKVNKKLVILTGVILVTVLLLAAVLITAGDSVNKKLEQQLDFGAKYLSELDYESAIVAYEAAIEIEPRCAEAYIGLAEVYVAMEDYDSAIDVLNTGLAATEDPALRAALEEVEALKGQTWEAQYDLGTQLMAEAKYEDAIIAFSSAIERERNQYIIYMARGDAYASLVSSMRAFYESVNEELIALRDKSIDDYNQVLTMLSKDNVWSDEIKKVMIEIYKKIANIYILTNEIQEAMEVLLEGYQIINSEELLNLYKEWEAITVIYVYTQKIYDDEGKLIIQSTNFYDEQGYNNKSKTITFDESGNIKTEWDQIWEFQEKVAEYEKWIVWNEGIDEPGGQKIIMPGTPYYWNGEGRPRGTYSIHLGTEFINADPYLAPTDGSKRGHNDLEDDWFKWTWADYEYNVMGDVVKIISYDENEIVTGYCEIEYERLIIEQ